MKEKELSKNKHPLGAVDVDEEIEDIMDVVEETALAVPAVGAELVGPGAFETLVAGVCEKVAMGVLTSVVQAEVKDVMVRYFFHIII